MIRNFCLELFLITLLFGVHTVGATTATLIWYQSASPSQFIRVQEYFNGGTNSGGDSGTNYGISFTSSANTNKASDLNQFGVPLPPSGGTWVMGIDSNSMNVSIANGFYEFSTQYTSSSYAPTLRFWTGVGGTGTLINSYTLQVLNLGSYATYFVTLTTTAKSMTFTTTGNSGGILFDQWTLTLGSVPTTTPVPTTTAVPTTTVTPTTTLAPTTTRPPTPSSFISEYCLKTDGFGYKLNLSSYTSGGPYNGDFRHININFHYSYNPCANYTSMYLDNSWTARNCKGSSLCQTSPSLSDVYDLGGTDTEPEWSIHSATGYPKLTYTSKNADCTGKYRKSHVRFICAGSTASGTFVFSNESPTCEYNFNFYINCTKPLESPYKCSFTDSVGILYNLSSIAGTGDSNGEFSTVNADGYRFRFNPCNENSGGGTPLCYRNSMCRTKSATRDVPLGRGYSMAWNQTSGNVVLTMQTDSYLNNECSGNNGTSNIIVVCGNETKLQFIEELGTCNAWFNFTMPCTYPNNVSIDFDDLPAERSHTQIVGDYESKGVYISGDFFMIRNNFAHSLPNWGWINSSQLTMSVPLGFTYVTFYYASLTTNFTSYCYSEVSAGGTLLQTASHKSSAGLHTGKFSEIYCEGKSVLFVFSEIGSIILDDFIFYFTGTNPPSTSPATEAFTPTTTSSITTELLTTAVDPTTVESTTVEPTTVKPTTVESTTVEPTTVEPTTVEPTIVESTTVEPNTIEPTSVESTTELPPSSTMGTSEISSTSHPETSSPSTETVFTTVLSTEGSKSTEAATTETHETTLVPITESSFSTEPSTSTLSPLTLTSEFTTEAATSKPTTKAATGVPTEVPSTKATATTLEPTTKAFSTTEAPQTASPSTEVATTTNAPTTLNPATNHASTSVPSTSSSSTEVPSTSSSALSTSTSNTVAPTTSTVSTSTDASTTASNSNTAAPTSFTFPTTSPDRSSVTETKAPSSETNYFTYTYTSSSVTRAILGIAGTFTAAEVQELFADSLEVDTPRFIINNVTYKVVKRQDVSYVDFIITDEPGSSSLDLLKKLIYLLEYNPRALRFFPIGRIEVISVNDLKESQSSSIHLSSLQNPITSGSSIIMRFSFAASIVFVLVFAI